MANIEQRTSNMLRKNNPIIDPLAPQRSAGRGQGRGVLMKCSNDFDAPPLPSPLLHCVEEREKAICDRRFLKISTKHAELRTVHRVRRLMFSVPCLVAVALLLVSCSRSNDSAKARQQSGGAPVPVRVAQSRVQKVPVKIQAIGTVQAYSVVSVRSQITGPITEMHFEEGQEVRAGDMLFTLDQRPWTAALNQAQANLQRDEAQMINARLQFERTSNLFVSKIASQQDFDTAESGYQASQAVVLADKAAITNARVDLDYTSIRAPIDGRTGSVSAKPGNVVKAPDDVLVTITQIRPVYVAFAVPEQHLPVIRRLQADTMLEVQALSPSDNSVLAEGKLTFIDNRVDTNTGTILLRGKFENADRMLWPGQFVQASLTLSNIPNAIVVPTRAVQTGQNGEYVFVVKSDQTVDARTVKAGIEYEGFSVISQGVQPGDTVVVDGQLRLKPGTKISVANSDATASTNAGASAE